MKKGKDGGEVMRPMFPRAHVNDSDKGGPKAPPRNKMALYERLSIPSQRFNSVPLSAKSKKDARTDPLAYASQENITEKNLYPPPECASGNFQRTGRLQPRQSDAVKVSSPLLFERRKKSRKEDEFSVPIFVHPGVRQRMSTHDDTRVKKITPSSCSQFLRPAEGHTLAFGYSNPLISEMRSTNERFRQDISNNATQSTDVSKKKCIISAEHDLFSQDSDCSTEHATEETEDLAGYYGYDAGKLHQTRVHTQERDSTEADLCQLVQYGTIGKKCVSSRPSMMDSFSGFDISPDDVVEIIGRRHFWRARTEIINQQRLFAVQVFELHRLIKVQKLIAGSPHILQQDIAYSLSSKDSFQKKVQRESISSHSQEIPLERADSSMGSGELHQDDHPYTAMGISPSTDGRMDSCCLHRHPSQQWLVPVMSPTEGLIYKPFTTGLDLMSPVHTGFGPVSPLPATANSERNQYFIPCPIPLYNPAQYWDKFFMSGSAVKQEDSAEPGSFRRSCNGNEVRGSSGGSPRDGVTKKFSRRTGTATELFRDVNKSNRVIRVVPRNPKSATESAVRIFESIKKERGQLDSL